MIIITLRIFEIIQIINLLKALKIDKMKIPYHLLKILYT